MSTRISSLLLAWGLASCGGAVQPQAAEGAQRIDCAIGPGAEFGPDCRVEREVRDGETLLVVRQPGGGYRRFVLLEDGRGLASADGADEVASRFHGGILETEVAGERYRFPAFERNDVSRR